MSPEPTFGALGFPRTSGVLLHPTSLPGPHGSGDLGPSARHFVDWLHAGGQSLWQMLPVGEIGLGHSPYMSPSAFAGNVLLVDLEELHRRGWLDASDLAPTGEVQAQRVDFPTMIAFRRERLTRAARRFAQQADPDERADLARFRKEHAGWLADYALFMSLAEEHGDTPWNRWPAALAQREAAALAQASERHAERIAFWEFCQWCFFRQWQDLRGYARARGVRLLGDLPIFVAHQSAEVWAHPELFQLDAQGEPAVVAGVPPDFFSATGQRWGNPLYRWSAHEAQGFRWWIERIRHSFTLFDLLRIDHFRGFEACWEIPANEPTALSGRWAKAPGDALFRAVREALGPQAIVAEDLGIITPEVEALRRAHGFPGMRVLQFAWGEDGTAEPRFQPHRHEHDSLVYTGTHDNDTTWGWWNSAPETVRHHVRDYFATDGHDISWTLIRAASASVADLAVFPMQDVLSLSSEHRMNVPGSAQGNWSWRFTWSQVGPLPAERLRRLAQLYGRLPT